MLMLIALGVRGSGTPVAVLVAAAMLLLAPLFRAIAREGSEQSP